MVGQAVDAQFDTTANAHVAVDEMGVAVDDQVGMFLDSLVGVVVDAQMDVAVDAQVG
jgi:hypothetical protein